MFQSNNLKKYLFLGIFAIAGLFIFFLPTPTYAADINVSGNIDTDTIWTTGNNYIVTGNINVKSPNKLTIENGVEVRFNSGTSLNVEQDAKIQVDGTAANNVTFTYNGTGYIGSWQGIFITGNGRSDISSTITYAKIYYGGGVGYWSLGAAFNITNASPLVQNTIFDSNTIGVAISGQSNPTFSDDTFNRNIWSPITLNPVASPTFQNVIYGTGNEANAYESVGLSMFNENRENVTENCTLKQITGIYRGSLSNPIPDIPYTLTTELYINNGATMDINPGLVIKMGPHDPRAITLINGQTYDGGGYGATSINVTAVGAIHINGTAANPVIFTSTYDDTYGAASNKDTNLDGSATTPGLNDWVWGLSITGNGDTDTSSIIDNAKFYYGSGVGNFSLGSTLTINNASPTIQNCLFDSVAIGLSIIGQSNPKIYNNKFYRNVWLPITMMPETNPDFQNVIYGTGADANGFEAIGLSVFWSESMTESATLKQQTGIYRGSTSNPIPDIPYVLITALIIPSGITLDINPGLVIKMGPHDPRSIVLINGQAYDGRGYGDSYFEIKSEGTIKANGTAPKPVIFTSTYDDTYGAASNKDTNLDGSATQANAGNWTGLRFTGTGRSDTGSIISYANFYYSGYMGWGESALNINNASPRVENSLFDSNASSIVIQGLSDPQIINDSFYRNGYAPISMLPDANPTFANVVYGTGVLSNGFESIGLGGSCYSPGPVETCTLKQQTGIYRGSAIPANEITDIPYTISACGVPINSGITMNINPGLVIKMGPNDPRAITLINGQSYDGGGFGYPNFEIKSGGALKVNGEKCNLVKFTSTYDDSIGGDTNLDGSTTPSAGNWDSLGFNGGSTGDFKYSEIYYAQNAINIGSGASNISIATSTFSLNKNGIYLASGAAPSAFNLYNLNFEDNTNYAIQNDNYSSYTVPAQNLWWGSKDGPNVYTNRKGVLTLYCPPNINCEWAPGSDEYAPLIYQNAPGGDYTVETKIVEYNVRSDNMVGLALFNNKDNAYLFGPIGGQVCFYELYNNSSWQYGWCNIITGSSPWLKAEVTGNTGVFKYSIDGTNWTTLATVDFASANNFIPTKVGLFAKEWGSSPIDPAFSYFKLNSYVDNFDNGTIGVEWTVDKGNGDIYEGAAGEDLVSNGDAITNGVNYSPWSGYPFSLCDPTPIGYANIRASSGTISLPVYDLTDPYLSNNSLRIYDDSMVKCFDLLETGHPKASAVRIQTASGTKSLRKQ